MAKKKPVDPEKRKQAREAGIKILKGKVPALAFAYLTQDDSRPYGQEGLKLGYNIFLKYLNDRQVGDFALGSLHSSEIEGLKSGKGFYSGSVNSKELILKAQAAVESSLNSIRVEDLKDVLGVKVGDKWKDKCVGDLGAKGASKEYKEAYSEIMQAYFAKMTGKYFTEALNDKTRSAIGNLEQRLQ